MVAADDEVPGDLLEAPGHTAVRYIKGLPAEIVVSVQAVQLLLLAFPYLVLHVLLSPRLCSGYSNGRNEGIASGEILRPPGGDGIRRRCPEEEAGVIILYAGDCPDADVIQIVAPCSADA